MRALKISLVILLGAALLVSGCSSGSEEAESNGAPTPTPTPVTRVILPSTGSSGPQMLAPPHTGNLVDFARAVFAIRDEREEMIGQWNAWLNSGQKEQATRVERLVKYEEFWVSISDMGNRVYRLYRPPAAREVHDKLITGYNKYRYAIEALMAYERAGDESMRASGNSLLVEASLLFRQAEEELLDLLLQYRITAESVGL